MALFAGCTVNDITGGIDGICGSSTMSLHNTNKTQLISSITEFYQNAFEQNKAELADLIQQKADADAARSTDVGTTLDTNIRELRAKLRSLDSEAESLRAKIATNSAEFEETTDPIRVRSGLYTMQDWVVLLTFITYAIAAVSVLAYIGYSSGWNKKMLIVSIIGIGIISILLYSFFIMYA